MSIRTLALFTVLVACASRPPAPLTTTPAPAPAPAAGGPTCASALEHSNAVSVRDAEAKQMTPEEAAENRSLAMQYPGIAVTACIEDTWSPELLQCLANVQSVPEQGVCESMLTKEQVAGFERRMKAAQ